ncbi:MAG: phosphoribosylanthranilate isomerase [Steroidobacteraceae bacterium]
MSRLWIKVCGLRTAEALAAAVAAGADAVGFVFHAASPRHLATAAARAMAATVPRGIEKVAVFLHPTQAELDAAIDAVRPDWVQTDAADLAALRLPAGQRVLPVYRTDRRLPAPQDLPRRFLLESGRSGAGERADWNQAAGLAAAGELVLAGGLDASNVAEAIAVVRPFGIDVSSGVESTRGVKDAVLIRNFVNAARAAQARAASQSLGVMQQ